MTLDIVIVIEHFSSATQRFRGVPLRPHGFSMASIYSFSLAPIVWGIENEEENERGLLWLRHEPLQSLAFALEPTPSFYSIHFINWCAKCVFSFSQDCFLLSG